MKNVNQFILQLNSISENLVSTFIESKMIYKLTTKILDDAAVTYGFGNYHFLNLPFGF